MMLFLNKRLYLFCALMMSIAIFFVAGRPAVGEVLNGSGLHWIAHIATYAVLAACYGKGLPRAPALLIGGLVVAIGGLHELYEVIRYGIDFEFHDVFYDGVGAFIGALLVRYGFVLPPVVER